MFKRIKINVYVIHFLLSFVVMVCIIANMLPINSMSISTDQNDHIQTSNNEYDEEIYQEKDIKLVPRHDIEYYYHGITMTDEEFDIFCRTIETEVTGEGNYDSKMNVAKVVLNRVLDSRFPNTIKEVCWANGQFSYSLTPDRYYNLPISETTKDVVSDVMTLAYDDTHGALFFCSGDVYFDDWATYLFTDDVGHRFYKT